MPSLPRLCSPSFFLEMSIPAQVGGIMLQRPLPSFLVWETLNR